MTDIMVFMHIAGAVGSYLFAGLIFTQKVGSRLHRVFGSAYAGAMLTTALSGFGIYNFGHPSVFHVFSLITVWSISRGVLAIYRYRKTRSKRALADHYFNMAYSFMGLNLAATAQALRVFSFESFMDYLTTVGVVYLVLVMFANHLIQKVFFRRFAHWFQEKPVFNA